MDVHKSPRGPKACASAAMHVRRDHRRDLMGVQKSLWVSTNRPETKGVPRTTEKPQAERSAASTAETISSIVTAPSAFRSAAEQTSTSASPRAMRTA